MGYIINKMLTENTLVMGIIRSQMLLNTFEYIHDILDVVRDLKEMHAHHFAYFYDLIYRVKSIHLIYEACNNFGHFLIKQDWKDLKRVEKGQEEEAELELMQKMHHDKHHAKPNETKGQKIKHVLKEIAADGVFNSILMKIEAHYHVHKETKWEKIKEFFEGLFHHHSHHSHHHFH